MRMRVGLFFGTFNPIHVGHLIIGNYFAQYADIDQVWYVVSPQNPFKQKSSLLGEHDRLHMVELGIEENDNLRASDIEFYLPKPSYTIDTLVHLSEKYPKHDFSIIMGADNLKFFHKWKNYETILKHYDVLVYKRFGYEAPEWEDHEKVQIMDVPNLEISASLIRNMIADGKSIRYLVPDKVAAYIDKTGFYHK